MARLPVAQVALVIMLSFMFFLNAWLLLTDTVALHDGNLECEDRQKILLSTVTLLQDEIDRLKAMNGIDRVGRMRREVGAERDAIACNDSGLCAWDVGVNRTRARILGIQRKQKAFLVVGVPTVQRTGKGRQYLSTTLDSLLAQMSNADRKDVVIVVFAADFDTKRREEVTTLIQNSYTLHVQNGLIQVIQAPKSFYRPLSGLKRNFGDSESRVKWRSKQCLDYAFLLSYCTGLGHYYLQLEDDVMSSAAFLSAIKDFVAEQNKPWVTLDFSRLGFIGKLYHDHDLQRLAAFIKFLYDEQPVDFLYRYFNAILAQKKPIARTPSLFQHMGLESSLLGKVQQTKDLNFVDNSRDFHDSDNPPAVVSTTLDAFASYVAHLSYSASPGYFWGRPPVRGDTFTVLFIEPQMIRRVVINTGDDAHPGDHLNYGRLEISQAAAGQEHSKKSDSACVQYQTVKDFKNGRVDAKLDARRPTKCCRIYATGTQDTWLLVKEIAVWTTSV